MDIHTSKKLNNGVAIPFFGLGVFQSKAGDETAHAVRWAIEAGYRHIDTAAIYQNEESVRRGIVESGVPREQIFLTTKLWNGDMRKGRQREAFENSLKLLGTDYVDLYLIHWPVPGKYKKSWKVLEELYHSGRVRAIGVSNFHQHHLDDLLADAKVLPAVNQVECHPRLSQEPLMAYCQKLNIAFEAWSPLGGTGGDLLQDERLKKIGAKYHKTPAQVVLRWDLQRGMITIPKSVHQDRIIANTDIYDFELTPEDMAAINGMNENRRVGADPDNFDF
ncbi:aldo/keto reductase [Candidatus Formimonas warabiya]|uniref:Glyoxal reductase n=1 Tax=Formimonas warabiya TaxID=1761012 RepID=A0A3G1KWL7_FORW1|nr:aldo/keto reductase [Candidatus Formimonas warabiya]ATW26831.1 glyoxal reductase [Candidatus Formimonas warabiya]